MQHSAHPTALSIARRPTLAFVSPRPMVLVVVRLFRVSQTKAVTMKDGQNRESGKAWNFGLSTIQQESWQLHQGSFFCGSFFKDLHDVSNSQYRLRSAVC